MFVNSLYMKFHVPSFSYLLEIKS